MKLHNLKPAPGSKGREKRIGRGEGSGHGGTSTRGHKGAQARSGYSHKIGFEGGQMPLQRRVPKFGFKNPNRVEYKGINVAECEEAPLGTASGEGRGYAVSGGVAAAVKKLVGDRFEVKPLYINGLSLKGIRQLQQYAAGDCPGNLVEVMTCEGGCVGGAGVMAPARKAARAVENFSKKGKV